MEGQRPNVRRAHSEQAQRNGHTALLPSQVMRRRRLETLEDGAPSPGRCGTNSLVLHGYQPHQHLNGNFTRMEAPQIPGIVPESWPVSNTSRMNE